MFGLSYEAIYLYCIFFPGNKATEQNGTHFWVAKHRIALVINMVSEEDKND